MDSRLLSNENRVRSIAALVVALSWGIARGEDWPGWRGTRGDGVATDATAPTHWSTTDNVFWRTEVPGSGHSSPIVSGERVFLTTCDEKSNARLLLAYDRTNGAEVWRTVVVRSSIESMHPGNTAASSTPTTDGERVYATFAANNQYFVAAISVDGKLLWGKYLAPFASSHGFHSCPILHNGSLLLAGLQDSDSAFVARVDAATGNVLWQTPTETPIRSFSPPHVTEFSGRKEVVVSGAGCTTGFDFVSGQRLWRIPGPAEKTVSSIVELNGALFVPGGRDGKLLAIKASAAGLPVVAWTTSSGVPYVPSPIIAGGVLHLVSDKGIHTQFDPRSGELLHRRRLVRATSASPILVGDHLYVTDESGTTTVLSMVNGEVKTLASNEIGESVFASPAFSNGDLFIRTERHLVCLREASSLAGR